MDKRYSVIFFNLLKDKDEFKHRMLRLGVSGEVSEEIIKKAPVILKKNLSLRDARIYSDAIFEAGARAAIQAEDHADEDTNKDASSVIVGMKDFIMCPQCGHKQVRSEACIKCGFVFKKG
ncbi:MAG: hypothetical protein JW944_14005 [Deltaproteobacteria bacterium]|nr:hypothetical protein [Deltaproteobacteria bacterium]